MALALYIATEQPLRYHLMAHQNICLVLRSVFILFDKPCLIYRNHQRVTMVFDIVPAHTGAWMRKKYCVYRGIVVTL